MCSISGYYCFGKVRPLKEALVKMILEGEFRGKDATGIGYFDNEGSLITLKGAVKATEFVKDIKWENWIPPTIALFHTRLATQGDEKENNNNHPIRVESRILIHNGMIQNDNELFNKYKFNRIAEVDSEILGWILGRDDYRSLFKEISGSFSVALLDSNIPDRLLLLRRTSPLFFLYDEKAEILYFASTRGMLISLLPKENIVVRGFTIEDRHERTVIIWESPDDTGYIINKDGLLEMFKIEYPPAVVRKYISSYIWSKGTKTLEEVKDKDLSKKSIFPPSPAHGHKWYNRYEQHKCAICLRPLKKALWGRGICPKCIRTKEQWRVR